MGAVGGAVVVAPAAAEAFAPALATALVATNSQVSWVLLFPNGPKHKGESSGERPHQTPGTSAGQPTCDTAIRPDRPDRPDQRSALTWPGPSAAAALGMSPSRNSLPMLGIPNELVMATEGCRYSGAETAAAAVAVGADAAVAAGAVRVACCWLLLVAASCGGSCCPTDCRCRVVGSTQSKNVRGCWGTAD